MIRHIAKHYSPDQVVGSASVRDSGPKVHSKEGSKPGACLPGPCYRMIDLLRLYRSGDGYDFNEMYQIYDCPDSSLSTQCEIEYNELSKEVAAEEGLKRSEVAKEVRDLRPGSDAPLVGGTAPSLLAMLIPRTIS